MSLIRYAYLEQKRAADIEMQNCGMAMTAKLILKVVVDLVWNIWNILVCQIQNQRRTHNGNSC